MMIQEIKQGMKVCNAGGDVFEIKGTKGDLVLVELLKHNSSFILVNHIHETFTPGKILEIDQTSETETFAGYCEVALEYLELVEEVEEIEIPMFDKGDVVKDKFGNLYVIEDLVSPQQLEQDSPEYDHMGYRLKIIEKNTSLPARKVGNVSGFYSDGACMWIYNTFGDAVNDEVLVTDAHIFATELELYDEEDADDVEEIGVSDVPIFLVGDLVKDKFGNTFKVVDADKFEDFSDDCMHYNVELVIKHPDSPIRKAGGAAEFEKAGHFFWIYDTAEDAESRGVIVNGRQLLATELVLVQSVLQTKSTKTSKTGKSKIQKPAKPAQAENADLDKALDEIYPKILEAAERGEHTVVLENDMVDSLKLQVYGYLSDAGFMVRELFMGDSFEIKW